MNENWSLHLTLLNNRTGQKIGANYPKNKYEILEMLDRCQIPYRTEGQRGKRQHCNNPNYNSAAYSRKMLMEDWGRFCRFWAPRQKNK